MNRTQAIAYLRRDPSGEILRERKAVAVFARKAGFEIVAEISNNSDTDAVLSASFAKVLRRIERNQAQTVIVASASCFAADSLVQAVGREKLSEYGISLIAADGSTFTSDLLTSELIKRVLDQAADFDNFFRHANRRGAKERNRIKVGPNWRKQYVDIVPAAVSLAKNLYDAARRAGTRITLRDISTRLAEAGHLNLSGKPFHPQEIDRMIKGPNRTGMGRQLRRQTATTGSS